MISYLKPNKKNTKSIIIIIIIIIIIMLFDNNNKKKSDLMCSDWIEGKRYWFMTKLTDQIVRLSAYKSLCL